MTETSKWQSPEDGFPTDEYFEAVAAALHDAGVVLETRWAGSGGWHREEPWEVTYKVARTTYRSGPLAWAEEVFVSWRCDELDDPQHADDFTGSGWFWVANRHELGAGGLSLVGVVKEFDLPYLAEPNEVAAAVTALVRPTGGEAS